MVSRHDYLPFGEEIPVNYGGRTTAMGYQANPALTQRFTGKERDGETGLDYFGARYLAGVLGRFTSADPPFADQHAGDPQSWNLYGYVRNNPLYLVDRDGRLAILAAAWAIAEVAGDVYDVYDTVQTLRDPNSSDRDKALSMAGLAAGVVLPGAGYGKGAKALAKRADDAIDAARAARRNAALGVEIGRIQQKIANQMTALDGRHLGAALRELKGEVVAINPRTGEAFDHVREVREAAQGLKKETDRIKRLLSSGDLSKKARTTLEQTLREANDKLKEVRELGIIE